MGNKRSLLINGNNNYLSFSELLLRHGLFIRQERSRLLELPAKMSANNSSANTEEAISMLTVRLGKAEKRLKVLTCEINDVRTELARLQRTPAAGTSRSFSTSITGVTEADGPSTSTSSCSNGEPECKRKRYEFTKEDEYVVVYTDGACENNGRSNAKAGIGVWFGPNHPLNVSQPVNGRATNNTAEIQACVKAVTVAHANGVPKLKIKTDSQFVINSMTKWIRRWKTNNWKVASGANVKNKEDFVLLDTACQRLQNVIWEHVEGHKGIVGNEEADLLARNGALGYIVSRSFDYTMF